MLRNTKGMTLLEVLIALLIFTIMSSAVFGSFIAAGRMDMSSKSFTEARGLAQVQLEKIYNYSQSLSYADSLYQVITVDGFSCTGFSWSVDAISGAILYSSPENVVTCTKQSSGFNMLVVFTRDTSITSVNLVKIKIDINSLDSNNTKRYETLYATEFK
jgi:prepilin-type N-terminal cleavage/methylation domain-containing protein